ncbi:MAG: serine protease, partial [Planctomycetota bacterium]|nr:serine protease [Planctomycetota bacterium]
RELPPDVPLVRHPSTSGVSSYSWPPVGLTAKPVTFEREPNDDRAEAQRITLPCDLAGSFFPADDSDIFEFEAKKGEEWWVEIASERFGLPTDPSAFVELVTGSGAEEKVTEVVEFTDIPSPVKVSSNGYAYDGPPYNAGSPDFLGKLVIPQDGLYRLHLTDLFGGTRNDPRNVYRLVIRKAQPDFAVVAWPLHMELRNGDRAALSKPLALRRGATVAMEVVAFRRDGFDGDIDLVMEGLPEGVSAQGLKIPAGKNRGLLLVTASATAPRSVAFASITAKGKVQGEAVSHPCRVATVAWPIPDSWGEIPAPRLSADVPVSVGGIDTAPITIAPSAGRVIEAKVGEKLTIAYTQTRRSEFSGASAPLRPVGAGFEGAPTLEVPLTADSSQVVIDLAALKLPPGDHQLAFVGYAVAKYRHQPEQIDLAKLAQQQAEKDVANLAEEAKKLAGDTAALEALAVKQKGAAAALAATNEQFKRATETAQPRDIVDILVTEPISVRIQPTESK